MENPVKIIKYDVHADFIVRGEVVFDIDERDKNVFDLSYSLYSDNCNCSS